MTYARRKRAHRLASVLIAIALLIASPTLPAAPALWVVKSPNATVYLFGTVHVLPAGMQWHYAALDKALAASDKLVIEENDDSPVTMQMLVLKYGLDLEHPLSGMLDTAELARLDAATRAAGLPGATALDPMRPWLAALTISVAPIVKAGFDPKSGADKQLERGFKARSKPVAAFETAEQQIKLFADLPPELQLDLLRNALDEYAKGPSQVKLLVKKWKAGNVAAIAANVHDGMREHYPELYSTLLVNRNRNWARQIKNLLKQHGTVFVAVGAGHLAGPDSVQAQLHKLGIETNRVH